MRPLFDSEPTAPQAWPSLRTLLEVRQLDLSAELAELEVDGDADRAARILIALETIGALLTGDLERIPDEAATQLRAWIRHSRCLGAKGHDA